MTAAEDSLMRLAGCSLDRHPGSSNWVEANGGLPQYICEIATDIGGDVSRAISIAVGRIKVWAAGGGGVKADTQAKAAAALAEWEALKAKAAAKKGGKAALAASSDHLLALSRR